jgi:hypothetical protein
VQRLTAKLVALARNLKLPSVSEAEGRTGHMSRDEEPKMRSDHPMSPIEHELTMHLERAHELAERAKRANGNARHEIERARAIADALNEEVVNGRRSKR